MLDEIGSIRHLIFCRKKVRYIELERDLIQAGFIDGAYVLGEGSPVIVENPSTGGELTRFNGLSRAQFEDAIAAARGAFDAGIWSDLPVAERVTLLRRFGAALKNRADRLVDLAEKEVGCPRATASMRSQVQTPLAQIDEIIDLFLSLPDFESNPLPIDQRIGLTGGSYQSLRRYTPIGVVAAIAAYNFPFLTALWKVVPALVAGNTVILRPSPLTPVTTIIFAEAAEEAGLPAGVFNMTIEGGIEGGQLLSTDPRVDMVAFTGSSAVGVKVMEQAAATMKRVQLELGGKSAQIFLPDAIEMVAPIARGAVTAHAGQGCAIGTRLFVPEENRADIEERLRQAFASIKIGTADAADTQLGPVISASQRARCEHFVQAAVDAGGTVVTGGRRPDGLGDGFFFEPTVIAAPDNGNPAAQEEIFGPVLVLIGYRDLDHAIAMANDSRYGLSGYVHGKDKRKALEVGLRIRSGTVNVNGAGMSTYVSSGGIKMSGLARERGVEGLRLYQTLSCINIG